MKKELLFLCLTIFLQSLVGKTAIPNSSFENWVITPSERPQGYEHTSNMQQYYDDAPFNMFKTTDAYHGQYALKLTTLGKSMAYILNTNPESGNPATWTNGVAFDQIPTGIRLYYKYNIPDVDSALLIVVFRKNKQTIAAKFVRFGGVKTEYTLFDHNFETPLTETPDSLIFGVVSSDFRDEDAIADGATLYIDSISFKGIAQQPALLNLSFEQWEQFNMPMSLEGWPGAKGNPGIRQSTDAKTGSYALKLVSFMGKEYADDDDVGVDRVWPGYISTGWWGDDCNCQVGGLPYTQAVDTITFWYKYMPMLDDEAELWLNFRKNGHSISHRAHRLPATENYTYVSYAFDIGQAPDSVVVQFQSSLWSNTATGYAGSTLIVDDVYFKSDLVSTKIVEVKNSDVKFGPNPVVDKLYFNHGSKVHAVYNSIGNVVRLKLSENAVDFSALPKGVYFVVFDTDGQRTTHRILKH